MPLKESPLDCDAWDWCVRKDRFAIRVPGFLFQPPEKDDGSAFSKITLEPIIELQEWLDNLNDEKDQYRIHYPPIPKIYAGWPTDRLKFVPFWISFKRENDLLMFRLRFYGAD
jgi:hypothetical protein